MKRSFDLTLSIFLLILLFLPIVVISIFVAASSKGPILHWSNRIGRLGVNFSMPKFRTMYLDSPSVETNLLNDPDKYITPMGSILRQTSLDELPQLWSIVKGDMSFVGPRPALFNQYELINLRKKKNIDTLVPGLTGWAQINGRDRITNDQKIVLDEFYLSHRSLRFDFYILWLTFIKVLRREGISH